MTDPPQEVVMVPSFPPVPADLQAEATAYQAEFTVINQELQQIYVKRNHNRARGLALLQWMRQTGINTVQVGAVLLRPHRDGHGFSRFKLDDPARSPHAEP